ncbi:MAG: D-tyrosyl-tRNA(Tyr) deacylase [Planctomycetes bacterium]|nr:D-tyrosyl-tRNA(Tyr) deacylase [Planctomycetota bacterium]
MKAVVQRVTRAEVRVAGESVGRIEHGLLVLLGVMRGDDQACARRFADRIARWRCFGDEHGRMNRDLREIAGGALVVSQVTLAADGKKGRRPSHDAAAEPETARALYEGFVRALEELGVPCRQGVFGAAMEVELVNDGPVTFSLEEHP